MTRNIFILATILFCISCSRPVSKFTYSGIEQKVLKPITFVNESKNADQYQWDFGDGQTSFEKSPVHPYHKSGMYQIQLKSIKGKKKNIMTQEIKIDPPSHCMVLCETKFGNMLIALSDGTPQHRDNFIKLVKEGFFNDLIFHRVINGFMIQGGDPNSRNASTTQQLGSGGPGYTIPAEFTDSLFHIKGALAAARTGDAINPEKKSSGSQFYIVQGQKPSNPKSNLEFLKSKEASGNFRYPSEIIQQYQEIGGTPQLDREYTVFGKVVEGLDVIDKIASQPTSRGDRPTEDVKMKMTLIE